MQDRHKADVMSKAVTSFLVASPIVVAGAAVVSIYLRVGDARHDERSVTRPPEPPPQAVVDAPFRDPSPPEAAKPAEATIPARAALARGTGEHDAEAAGAAFLVRALEKDPDRFRLDDSALRRLRSMGEDAVPDLRRALRHASPTVRETACWTLEILGPSARAAVPDLVKALEDGSQRVQEQAAQALGAIGAAAADAIPRLVELGEDYRVEPLNDIARVAAERIREALRKEQD